MTNENNSTSSSELQLNHDLEPPLVMIGDVATGLLEMVESCRTGSTEPAVCTLNVFAHYLQFAVDELAAIQLHTPQMDDTSVYIMRTQ